MRKESNRIEGVFYCWNESARNRRVDCDKFIEKSAYDKAIAALKVNALGLPHEPGHERRVLIDLGELEGEG